MKGICLLAQSPRVGSTAWYNMLSKSLSNYNFYGEFFNKNNTNIPEDKIVEKLKDKNNVFIKVIPYQVKENIQIWLKENFEFITLKRLSLTEIVCSYGLANKNQIWNERNFTKYTWNSVAIQQSGIEFIISNIIKFENFKKQINPIVELKYTSLICDFVKLPYNKKELIENYNDVPNMIHQYCESIKFDYKSYGYTVEPE